MSNMKFSCVFLMLFLVLISGCNGGGSDTDSAASIRGIAAAGAPIVGTVNIRGANGKTSDNEINADGTYRVDVSALTAPFLIWAEGTANGNNVKLYTTVDTAKKNANITPATNLVLTMALGQDPAAVYKNDPDAEVPDSSEIVSAEKQVQALLSRVFDSLGMPEDFNLMNGEFEIGKTFDRILDTVSFEVDSSNSENVTVVISDMATGTTLFEHNASRGETSENLGPEKAEEIVRDALTFQGKALEIMKKIVTLNEMIRRTKTEVEEIISPYIASEFLDDGTNREEWIDGWILDEDDDEEDFSVKGISVSILRAMSHKKKLGDFEIDEMPGYEAGNWCLVTFEENGMPGSFLTAFVEDSDGVVKWYGNRVPFYFESDIYSIHVLDRGDDREDKMS